MSPSLLCFLAFWLVGEAFAAGTTDPSFDTNYKISFGNDHVQSLNQGREIQLSIDKSSGSGIQSKLSYGSGFFSLRIMVPGKESAGVVTAFYLFSHTNNHDELDFEFLGSPKGKPYTLQTNVFANGVGNRKQKIRLWFDPTADFHNYQILWNQHQIVFFVDNVPIRVYKNKASLGVNYPTHAMQVEATLWDGSSWLIGGGGTKVNWSLAPFKANFQGFNINGCPSSQNSIQPCSSPRYWWNSEKYWQLNSNQERAYEGVKRKYMAYDYCSDRSRYPSPPKECPQ